MTSSKIILLVDDSPRIRPLVRQILRGLSHRILEAASAEEALELAETVKGEIDLLITDISMPGKTGVELAAELRTRNPGLRVLYMSGTGLPTSAIGGTFFIEKPFRPDALIKQVREILGSLTE